MTVIKNVAIAGASGNLGPPVLKALIDSGKFNVTVFKRADSNSTFGKGIKVVEVDYSSLESLTAALSGQDAVVSTLAHTVAADPKLFVDAAIAAKVKRFIPSEFGSNLDNAKTRALPVFDGKAKLQDYLISKAASTDLTYTFIYTSAFLDWGLKHDFILKTSDGKPVLIDGGDLPFSATDLPSIGQSVVGVLEHLEETKNRSVRVCNIITTQNKLLAIAKKVAPEKKWEPSVVKLSDMVAGANERLKKNLFDMETFAPFIFQALFGPENGGVFEKNDNELLGVKPKTDEDVEAIFKELLA